MISNYFYLYLLLLLAVNLVKVCLLWVKSIFILASTENRFPAFCVSHLKSERILVSVQSQSDNIFHSDQNKEH
jgi:hypothetical protein